jgi:hypothetical protein
VQFENAPGKRVRNRSQISLPDFPGVDRDEAWEVRIIGHRLCQQRGANAVDPDAARQLDRRGFHKAFNDVIDDGADHAARYVLIREDPRDQGEGAFVGDERERRPDQIDLAHALSLDRVGPLLVGCLFERRKGNIARGACYGFEGANLLKSAFRLLGSEISAW